MNLSLRSCGFEMGVESSSQAVKYTRGTLDIYIDSTPVHFHGESIRGLLASEISDFRDHCPFSFQNVLLKL